MRLRRLPTSPKFGLLVLATESAFQRPNRRKITAPTLQHRPLAVRGTPIMRPARALIPDAPAWRATDHPPMFQASAVGVMSADGEQDPR